MVVSIRSLVAATMMSFLSFTLAAPSALPNVIWTSRTHEPGVTQGGVKTYQVKVVVSIAFTLLAAYLKTSVSWTQEFPVCRV